LGPGVTIMKLLFLYNRFKPNLTFPSKSGD